MMPSHGGRISPTKRTKSTPSSPSRTGQRVDLRRLPSPPRTPLGSNIRSGKTQDFSHCQPTDRPAQHETFYDDNTPDDVPPDEDRERYSEEKDPHDLAFSPKYVPRMSMFDNMLLSLNGNPDLNEPEPAVTIVQRDHPDLRTRFHPFKSIRRRGHTFSSSVSSENDTGKENYFTQGHKVAVKLGRSNSNSNFQNRSQKLANILGEDEPTTRARVFLAQRAVHPSERTKPPHTKSRPSSNKSSASSSVDLAQILSGSRLGPAGNRRSQSFDLGLDKDKITFATAMSQLEAAPTPVVPAGPAARQIPLPPSPSVPYFGRKNSVRSSSSRHGRKDRAATIGNPAGRTKADLHNDAKVEALPALPTQLSSPLFSPPLNDRNLKPGVFADNSATIKEKQGFFRRVFGSSRIGTLPPPRRRSSHAPQNEATASGEVIRPDAPDASGHSIPPPKPSKPGSKESNAQNATEVRVITRKSSAFFRRRKKSVTEDIPIPPPPPLNVNEMGSESHANGLPSPVSSLRQVMDPYLAEKRQSNLSFYHATSEETRPESPQGYHTALSSPTPPQASQVVHQRSLTQEVERAGRVPDRPALQIPAPKRPANLRAPNGDKNMVSFLADSSIAENSTRSSKHSSSLKPDRPKTSPTVSGQYQRISTDQGGLASGSTEKEWREGKGLQPNSPRDQPPTSPVLTIRQDGMKTSSRMSGSEESVYRSAPSTPVKKQSEQNPGVTDQLSQEGAESTHTTGTRPGVTEDYREKALKLFENRDNEIESGAAAAWLGDSGTERECVRMAYMELFDWTNLDILAAMRGLCDRIALKGETQQVDRILDSFARRWCQCNANHGFRSTDVVHTVCYSILLLNTDLHLAEIESKMTKGQFVRNVLPTIKNVLSDADTGSTDTIRTSSFTRRPSIPPPETRKPDSTDESPAPASLAPRGPVERLVRDDSGDTEVNASGGGLLVTTPFTGSERDWGSQIETVLKSFYTSISRQRLPLFGAAAEATSAPPTSNGLLTVTGNMLRRTPSTLSKNPPETLRGRATEQRSATARWSSKPRSRPRLHPGSALGSSRTSLDEQSSGWSPGMSSTWSKVSLNKTLTSMSMDSLGSELPHGDYQKSVGFANALSQAFMRDDQVEIGSVSDCLRAVPLLEDESLELCGAPWAKEGTLKHRCHMEGPDKRSKGRNWTECFAVIEKGWMRLFSFSMNAKSLRQKTKQQQRSGVVGGGNWTDNAEEIWKFLLRQTIANALPPPGYAKGRQFVWALSLPNGSVHLFQAGTEDIVKEFVSTANYWSARLSKEPLTGGVSNMEYGWSDAVITSESQPNLNTANGRPSTQNSIRSSIDHGGRPKLHGDRIHINDWLPPQQNTIASQLMEVDQLKALQAYVKNVEAELQAHNKLRSAMLLAYSQRHQNATKAMTNWERKSSYLLKEIVKFRTYIDSLQTAQAQKEKVYAMRKEDGESRGRADGGAMETAASAR